MEIKSIKPIWDDILQAVESGPVTHLEDERRKTLNELLAYIKNQGIAIVYDGQDVDDEMLEKIIAYCLPRTSPVAGGYVDQELAAGIERFKKNLQAYMGQHPGEPLGLLGFVAIAHTCLSNNRVDEYVLDGYVGVMDKEFATREKYTDELRALTAELKVYSIVQAQINAWLAKGNGLSTGTGGVNLLDRTLYGYGAQDDKWFASAEYKFMKGLDTVSNDSLSIKGFLCGKPKESGAMNSSQVEDWYKFEKDNNPLANFATMVGDVSRPINDRVSEKTTLLNDVSSRYNSAIEAINRFVQKYASVLSDILRAI